MINYVPVDVKHRKLFAWHRLSLFEAVIAGIISSFVFWVFLFAEGRHLEMSNLWLYVVLNLSVGLSLALPLFLYFREATLESAASTGAATAD